jgi:tetratricopeptide (TPR) repeat protein
MKRWLILVGVVMLAVGWQAAAQEDDGDWRLRVPTAGEYLTAVPDIVHHYWEELPTDYGKILNQPIINAIIFELSQYPEQDVFSQKFELLSETYSAVATDNLFHNSLDNNWNLAIFKAWLRENEVDFPTAENIEIAGYSVSIVESVDFNGDGKDEIILDFQGYPDGTFLVLEADENLPEHYRIVPTGIPWIRLFSPFGGEIFTISFQDLTGDGLPEWTIYAVQSNGPGMWTACGNYHIVTWRDETMPTIFDGGAYCEGSGGGIEPKTVELLYPQLDTDLALEIQQQQNINDPWRCLRTTTATYDWNGERYDLRDTKNDVAETPECALSEAETLMWQGKADEAIPLFERSLALAAKLNMLLGGVSPEAERIQYGAARLTLAYSLTGRDEEADSLLSTLEAQQPESEMMTTLIAALSQAQANALSLCSAAYNVFWEYRHSMFSYALPSTIIVGREREFQGMIDDTPPDPKKAGCDAPNLINGLLEQSPFTQDQSPVDQLQQRGIEVDKYLRADMNQDGKAEWLVWTKARVNPIFFAPVGDTYLVSRPDVRHPNIYTQAAPHILPSGDKAIVDWAFVDTPNTLNTELFYYDIGLAGYGYGCLVSDSQYGQYRGDVRLFGLHNNRLEVMLQSPLCTKMSIGELFQREALELTVWDVVHPSSENNSQYEQTVYYWDAAQNNYVSPIAQPEAEAPPISSENNSETSETLLNDEALFGIMDQANTAIYKGDYEVAVDILDHALEQAYPAVNMIAINGLHYYRALALEALERPEEALAEYVAIYEAAPESAWGRLAGLHIER